MEALIAAPKQTAEARAPQLTLTGPQHRLLGILLGHQRRLGVDKLIIGDNGRLQRPGSTEGVADLVAEMYGDRGQMRVTEEGIQYLKDSP